MDSELTRPSELDESQSSKLSSVNPSDMEKDAGSDSDSDSDSSNDGAGSVAAPQVEWLATGRQRRATAGNRMKSMLANEEPDSDLELLFAEDENDQGFSDAGDHASDVQMDSSSDEDDNNDDDELEGEKELDRQAKERRAAQRKRKAQEAIPAKFRKKVRIDTSNSTPRSSVPPSTPQPNQQQQQPRPKKKSERSSWLPSVADLPTRASSRQTTRLSKEQLHAQMEEREAKRLKQLAQMQKKAARLEALKKPPMTQEERLREAAIVEERNSKSLNRWEEAEKQREEERRAKLAALHERTLSGPVISFWSGMGRFGDGWRKGEGIHVAIEEKPKKAKKEKAKKKDEPKDGVKQELTGETKPADGQSADASKPPTTTDPSAAVPNGEVKVNANKDAPKQDGAEKNAPKNAAMADAPNTQPEETTTAPPPTDATGDATITQDAVKDTSKDGPDVTMTDAPTADAAEKTVAVEDQNKDDAANTETAESKALSEGKPTDDAEALTKDSDPKASEPSAQAAETATDSKESEPQATASTVTTKSMAQAKETQPPPASNKEQTDTVHATSTQNITVPPAPSATNGELPKTTSVQPIENESLPVSKAVSQVQSEAATPQPEQARSPLDGIPTTRDAIIYQNFDENAIKDKNVQTQVLFGRKMGRLPKPTPAPMCLITNNPARYRDPKTDLHFYSAAAFKELQRVQSGEYRWSKLLGAWAGSGTYAARGVPERFLNPARCPTLEEVQRIERKKEEKEKLKLQQAEDEKKAKDKTPAASNKQASADGAAASSESGVAAAGGDQSIPVKTEDTNGTKAESPAVAA